MKTITSELGSASALVSTLSARLEHFLSPLLVRLDQVLDRRLVKTFAATLSILLEQRYRARGLLLSELGAFLGGFAHAPAGTKRLSNLLRSRRWSATLLEDHLWSAAERQLTDLLRLRLPAQPARSRAATTPRRAAASLPPPNRKAEPRGLDSALPPACCDLLSLPESPNFPSISTPKFGMTRVSLCGLGAQDDRRADNGDSQP